MPVQGELELRGTECCGLGLLMQGEEHRVWSFRWHIRAGEGET